MDSPVSDTRPAPTRPTGHVRRIARSFGFALEGLTVIVRTQPNFWVHLLAAALALGLGVLLQLSLAELTLIVLTIVIVLVIESVNTAFETLCDLVSPDDHPLVKRAKDVSAATVLLAAIGAVVVALLLFGPRLLKLAGLG